MPIGHRIFFRAFTRMARAWEKLAVHNGHVDWSNGIPTIVVDSVEDSDIKMDYSGCAFGFQINPDGDDPDLVRILAGQVEGKSLAQTDITVQDNDSIYIAQTYTTNAVFPYIPNNTLAIQGAASVPTDDDDHHYYRLYQFTVTDGTASIKNVYKPYDIGGIKVTGAALGDAVFVITALGGTNEALTYKYRSVIASQGLLSFGPESGWVSL